MKKLFLVAAVAVSMALASCNGGAGGVKCWAINWSYMGVSETVGYVWGTSAEADEAMNEAKAIMGGIGTWSKKGTNKSEADCD